MVFQFFRRYLFSQRSGALIRVIARLSVIGIGVGMMSLVIVMSVMSGFNVSIREKLLVAKPHVVIEGEKEKLQEWTESLNSQQSVKASLVKQQDVIIKTMEGDFGGAIAKGVGSQELTEFFNRIEQPNSGDVEVSRTYNFDLASNEVVLGIGLARALDIYEGDQLLIIPPETLLMPADMAPLYEKVTVTSIVETEIQDVDSQFLYFNRENGLKRLNRSKSLKSIIEVRLKDPDNFSQMVSLYTNKGARVSTWQDRDQALFYALKMEKIIMGSFISIATLITCFSIITVLMLLITQKRKEIGVLMALGMARSKVKKLYVGLGLTLSMFGLIGGITLGVVFCLLISGVQMDILPDIYYDRSLPVKIDPIFVISAFAVGATVALIGSIVPVYYSIRYNSAEAMNSRS